MIRLKSCLGAFRSPAVGIIQPAGFSWFVISKITGIGSGRNRDKLPTLGGIELVGTVFIRVVAQTEFDTSTRSGVLPMFRVITGVFPPVESMSVKRGDTRSVDLSLPADGL